MTDPKLQPTGGVSSYGTIRHHTAPYGDSLRSGKKERRRWGLFPCQIRSLAELSSGGRVAGVAGSVGDDGEDDGGAREMCRAHLAAV